MLLSTPSYHHAFDIIQDAALEVSITASKAVLLGFNKLQGAQLVVHSP